MSFRALGLAVVVAFVFGMVATLAIRPPGGGGVATNDEGETVSRVAKLQWRVPISFSTNIEVLGDNIIFVADTVSALSGGEMTLLIAEPKEIVPEFSIVDAVREGKVKAGYTWLGYDQGKIPASPLIAAVPFGFEPWEYTAWWYEGGGRELAEDLYRRGGVEILYCGLIGPETAGWFREPIESLEDLNGLKIRFAGLGGQVIQRLGASVTMIPGAEIFQALEKGAIDATEYSLPNIDEALGFDKIAKLNYFPGWHQVFTSTHFVINSDAWAALDSQQQTILETACTAGVARNFAKAEAMQGPIIANFKNRGVTANKLPLEMLRELKRISDEVMAEEAARDEDFARIYQSQQEFRADYEHWKRLAYLPRDF